MDKLTGSEAVYGFCGWLTTRREIKEMGSSKNCSPIVDLITQFCEVNSLEEPRENYHEILVSPKE